jgi:hypothetical protein
METKQTMETVFPSSGIGSPSQLGPNAKAPAGWIPGQCPTRKPRTQAPPTEEELNRRQFLNLLHLPAIVYDREAGWLLGFRTEDIGKLVAAGLLVPLGHVDLGDCKRFATVELQAMCADEQWMAAATDFIYGSRKKPVTMG